MIALAVAAPAASASDKAWDGVPGSLNRGNNVRLFTADLTQRIEVWVPNGFTFFNYGTAPVPAGTPVLVRYDNRLFTPTEIRYSIGNFTPEGDPIAYSTPIVSGNSSEVTFIFPVEVPPNTDVFSPSAIRVLAEFDTNVLYPHDAFDDIVPASFQLVLDDANPGNNMHGPWGVSSSEPATPWGVLIDRVWEPYSWNNGACYAELAASGTFTSVGPNPARATDQISVVYDNRIATSVSALNITLNGISAPGLVAVDKESVSGNYGQTLFKLSAPLLAGDVLHLDFSYVYAPETGQLDSIEASGLFWHPTGHESDLDIRQMEPPTVSGSNMNSYCKV